jgi:hypothetical protein
MIITGTAAGTLVGTTSVTPGGHLANALILATRICPRAPGNAQHYANELTGYVLWGVLALFLIGVVVGVGAVVGGRIYSMPHASKLGVISIVVVFFAAVGYMILPGMVHGITGSGCVG